MSRTCTPSLIQIHMVHRFIYDGKCIHAMSGTLRGLYAPDEIPEDEVIASGDTFQELWDFISSGKCVGAAPGNCWNRGIIDRGRIISFWNNGIRDWHERKNQTHEWKAEIHYY